MGPGHVRLQVHAGKHVAVIPDGATAIAPRSSRGKTIVVAIAALVAGRCTRTGTCDGGGVEDLRASVEATGRRQFTRTEDRIAAITGIGLAFQTADVGHADFTDQGQTVGAHDLIEEMRERRLELGDFLAVIAVQILTGDAAENRRIGQRTAQRTHTGEQNVGGVQLHRRIRPVADLTAPRRTGRQGGGEAQTIQTNVFWVLDEVFRVTRNHQRPQCLERAWQCLDAVIDRLWRTRGAEDRRTAVVVHEVGTEFGGQRIEHVLGGNTKLPTVPRVAVRGAAHQNAFVVDVDIGSGQWTERHAWNRRTLVQYPQVVIATGGHDVGLREKRAAVIGNALGHVEHVDRDQAFLDLGTWTTERGHVDRVDRVDTAANESTFTPVHNLLAQTHRTRLIGNGVVVVNEGVEDLAAR